MISDLFKNSESDNKVYSEHYADLASGFALPDSKYKRMVLGKIRYRVPFSAFYRLDRVIAISK